MAARSAFCARRWLWHGLLALAAVGSGGCAHALSQAAAARSANPLHGIWVIDQGPSFPGPRYLRIAERDGRPHGSITTDWYGDVPMQQLLIDGGVARFQIDNGNPRLPAQPWTATLEDGQLHVAGRIWDEQVDVRARRGSEADAARLAFPVTPLPDYAALPSDGLARTPPLGWSSWNRFAEHIDDATVRQIADAMVASGLRDAGYVYVNIDDGWQGERDRDGVLQPNARFPDMRALADYVHGKGLKLGLYSSPGPKTCAGYAGSYGHVEQDARTWAGWGIDYVKYDLCSGEGIFRDPQQVRRAYLQMGQALRATGRPIVYSLCQYGRDHVGQWGREVGGHLWRTTGDIEDSYAKMASIGFDRNGDPADAGPGGWNDPDMLEVGNGGMSVDEYRTHMALWALSAAPLLLGNDLRQMTPATLAILRNREVLAIDQDALGVQGRAVRKDGAIEIWRKPLADGGVALGVFNRDTQPQQVMLTADDAGTALHGRRWRDLWRGRSQAAERLRSVQVAAHGVVLLRLSPPPAVRAH
ncbi:glycoside hydrolase family 27 protein [Xanthomonas sp. NCPPB 2654]|uniref:glycoside hydrolase family 27 protein n=1 Tax=unclassified Xanthomonas TaxID=2643310 RepID=UPI0021DF6D7C|nr:MULTISPECIES: glycoside hydrolase family 27 protein [unclassified Xanthomonas]MDL5366317.1 glycoside hydrolase family 27 protein [Xanthomonas sp. NCPPB 2654]UYC22312.1 glycoside hydrolase family 27 protein [Xanthomonas sp. CFBP 8443]